MRPGYNSPSRRSARSFGAVGFFLIATAGALFVPAPRGDRLRHGRLVDLTRCADTSPEVSPFAVKDKTMLSSPPGRR